VAPRRRILILSRNEWHAESLMTLAQMARARPLVVTDRDRTLARARIPVFRLQGLRRMPSERAGALLNAIARDHRIDVVVPADTRFTRWLIEHARVLKTPCFPLPDLNTFRTLRHKGAFARFAERRALAHPATVVVRRAEDADEFRMPLPLIVKPAQGEGGRLVERVDDRAALRAAVARTLRAQRGAAIVQRVVDGEDIDLSVLADRGRVVAWTIQQRNERGAVYFREHDRVLELGRRLCELAGHHGVAHIDMRLDAEGKPVLIECNPRFWASACDSARAGVNFLERGLDLLERRDATDPGRARPRIPS